MFVFAIVQTEKFKPLCAVTDRKTKLNIDSVHDVRLNLINFCEILILFASNEAHNDQYRWS